MIVGSPCREACRRSPSGAWWGVGIWLARQDRVLLAAAAESECRLVIWLAPVRLDMGFRRAWHRTALAAERRGSYLPLGLAAVPGRVEPVGERGVAATRSTGADGVGE